MIRVGLLTAANMLETHASPRPDAWEHERQYVPMRRACEDRGIDLRVVIWDDPELKPDDFEAFVIGTTWDYASRPREFLSTLDRLAARRPLLNPVETVRWNLHKGYLNDLAARGARIVRTLWHDRADGESIARSFDALETDAIVIKPQIGAAAWRQVKLRRGEPLPHPELLPPAATMIQPFLPAIAEEGEYSLVYFDRVFSHCALKTPADGDYRIQSMFGGSERAHRPSESDLSLAQCVLDAVDGPLLYARVDMVRDREGELAVMELEVIEPYLYPDQGPRMGEAFAGALERMLATARDAIV